MTTNAQPDPSSVTDFDVIVIGAGFAGLYMLHKLRELGFSARVLEMGDGVGGTWYWNRYPGARCDVQSIEYSFSFSKEIEQEWNWTELMPPQPEVEAYLNFVADRLELRDGIQLSTKVTALTFDDDSSTWIVQTAAGERIVARFVVAATGCLSAPLEPAIAGMDSFSGVTLYTNRFPKHGFDFTGKRVAVVGTGSSGVQAIPVIAEDAASLHVFQRSAAYTIPANNRPLEHSELESAKANYANLRERQRSSYAGVVAFGALSGGLPPGARREPRKILETPMEDRLRTIDEFGWAAPLVWTDVMMDLEANRAGAELYGEVIRRHVKDPAVATALVPDYPMGCKRQIIDTGYFDTFNRDNVTLVDLRKEPILEITPQGVRTQERLVELDVIVFATGFDAITGALTRIDIRGRDGTLLRDLWASEGPAAYLGLGVAGFPNLFTVTGPFSPSVLSNMVVSIEQHVEWIGACLDYLRANGHRTIEATPDAQTAWLDHSQTIAKMSVVRTSESCTSWYVGANVPGKKRMHMPYLGGLPAYRRKCDEVAAGGYEGFALT